jgi:hypothetical protein
MKSSPHEALVRARIAVDQVRLSRLATQNAIERNRQSLAEIKARFKEQLSVVGRDVKVSRPARDVGSKAAFCFGSGRKALARDLQTNHAARHDAGHNSPTVPVVRGENFGRPPS